ncbi:hypothetical protein COX24_00210 [bacterium (Candidatus Gribaldobacteria) CG23_combo_of_CG06-09_8_20_14_all_37_87_8]|uniref:Uncharacterized protein n=1 Tax=bacterium (Candidatus Gribaldobacteria) CG23_combo_of_CG06-09_8_20_14_all_37_87_8 TaxID=2014278 RepID=A0A2G9ZFX7_9BACT|nr:MAG: hypothetical protein COX24_00210 [bacterium (Candidatus Gribaldobacteria) CG23_combo_of_CG06-09_8_20_14_all_37_87_8]
MNIKFAFIIFKAPIFSPKDILPKASKREISFFKRKTSSFLALIKALKRTFLPCLSKQGVV